MTTNPVRFGIVGCGRIAKNAFVPALAESELATLHAAASRARNRAAALEPAKVYDDYAALLADPEVEAVYIATHNGLHRELAVAALSAGKHVLCEKPLACTAAECEEMLAAAQQADRHLVEAFMYRHAPRIRRAAALVGEGAIGAVRYVQAAFSFVMGNADDVRWKREWGGGALYDVGCYCVNACRMFLGDRPDTLRAVGRFHPQHGVDLSLHGTLAYGAERFGVISCGFDAGLYQHLVVVGEAGALEVPEPFFPQSEGPAELRLRTASGLQVEQFEPQNVFRLELEDLARAIRDGNTPLLAPEDGLHNARILEALLKKAPGS